MARTQRCTSATRAGRLAKARQFQLAAETIAAVIEGEEIEDAYVTLCVHAGIAAADVICCVRLGEHHQGESHADAVALLAKADRTQGRNLKTLLDLKTRSGYGAVRSSVADQKRAGRAAAALLQAADEL